MFPPCKEDYLGVVVGGTYIIVKYSEKLPQRNVFH